MGDQPPPNRGYGGGGCSSHLLQNATVARRGPSFCCLDDSDGSVRSEDSFAGGLISDDDDDSGFFEDGPLTPLQDDGPVDGGTSYGFQGESGPGPRSSAGGTAIPFGRRAPCGRTIDPSKKLQPHSADLGLSDHQLAQWHRAETQLDKPLSNAKKAAAVQPAPPPPPPLHVEFVAAKSFGGALTDFVFRFGASGLGYYRDRATLEASRKAADDLGLNPPPTVSSLCCSFRTWSPCHLGPVARTPPLLVIVVLVDHAPLGSGISTGLAGDGGDVNQRPMLLGCAQSFRTTWYLPARL